MSDTTIARRLAGLAAGGALALVGYRVVRRLRAVDVRGQAVVITGGSRGRGCWRVSTASSPA